MEGKFKRQFEMAREKIKNDFCAGEVFQLRDLFTEKEWDQLSPHSETNQFGKEFAKAVDEGKIYVSRYDRVSRHQRYIKD